MDWVTLSPVLLLIALPHLPFPLPRPLGVILSLSPSLFSPFPPVLAPQVYVIGEEGILQEIDATGAVEEVTQRAMSALRRFASTC